MTLRVLADENTPGAVVTALRMAGFDVAWVTEIAPGLTDQDVLAWASREARILLTLDTDFGELARHAPLATECGIVLLRLRELSTAEAAQVLVQMLASGGGWAGHISVVETGRIRRRALQATAAELQTGRLPQPKQQEDRS